MEFYMYDICDHSKLITMSSHILGLINLKIGVICETRVQLPIQGKILSVIIHKMSVSFYSNSFMSENHLLSRKYITL